jgi:methyltransferase family protein
MPSSVIIAACCWLTAHGSRLATVSRAAITRRHSCSWSFNTAGSAIRRLSSGRSATCEQSRTWLRRFERIKERQNGAVRTLDSVDALNRILDIATAFWKSQMFFTACRLGVFEALAETPATQEDLARRLGVNPLACRRLLVPLRELGLVNR